VCKILGAERAKTHVPLGVNESCNRVGERSGYGNMFGWMKPSYPDAEAE
jgi:hypothetical protein